MDRVEERVAVNPTAVHADCALEVQVLGEVDAREC